jgi:hypothetical protein
VSASLGALAFTIAVSVSIGKEETKRIASRVLHYYDAEVFFDEEGGNVDNYRRIIQREFLDA